MTYKGILRHSRLSCTVEHSRRWFSPDTVSNEIFLTVNLWFVLGLLHTNPNKFENASFSLLWLSVITRNCEEHESGVFQQTKRVLFKNAG